MDQQQKAGDKPVETIAKTIPGEFVSLIVLLKSFVSDESQLLVLGLITSLLVPIYAARVLQVESWAQRSIMFLSFLAWLFMLLPEGVDNVFSRLLSMPFSFKSNVSFFAALVLVLQFALPFLTKPSTPRPASPAQDPAIPAQNSPAQNPANTVGS